MKHKKYYHGFTIVELLIVIVVIAILASLSIAAYTGVQKKARNTARIQELVQWQRLFELYKAEHGVYPSAIDTGNACLGTGFPNGASGKARCRDYSGGNSYYEEDNADLMTALRTVGSLPSGDRTAPGGTTGAVGPYVTGDTSRILLVAVIDGDSLSNCQKPTTGLWTNGSNTVLCFISLPR